MIIAHISDTHIKEARRLAYRKVDTAAAFEACVRRLNALEPAPDVVVMTGDLGDLGTAAEYSLFREIAGPLRAPLLVTPGNHDAVQPMRAAFTDQPFARNGGDFLHAVCDDWPVRLVGFDSTVPGAPGGLACPFRLDWLSRTLADGRDKPTIVFMHHPPFLTGIDHMDRQNCANGDALGDVLAANPQVEALLCGHVHRSIRRCWRGVEASIAPGTSHAVAFDLSSGPPAFTMDPPAIQLIVWEAKSVFNTHIVYVNQYEGPYPFFDANGHLID